MSRQWIHNKDRGSQEYLAGVSKFMKVAMKHVNYQGNIRCPCQKCSNSKCLSAREVVTHLVRYGMSVTYTTWIHHGDECPDSSNSTPESSDVIGRYNDDVMGILNDAYPYVSHDDNMVDATVGGDTVGDEEPLNVHREQSEKYERLLKEAQKDLWDGCEEFSVLTAVVELMHAKVQFLMSNKCFDHLLGIIKRMLPKENNLPQKHDEAKKILKDLGLGYEKIHACKYDCALYYKENEMLDKCPICEEPRYKMNSQEKKKIPQKVLRYFPLKPRLQRLYMSEHTASDMRWHKDELVDDGVLRHPADGLAWKDFDKMYPDFAQDPRNVRLGLATDGFNPYGNMSTNHSVWPVLVFPYNLPPWRCMKKEFTILSTLIPGPKSPGKEIDVYLRPLIDELKELWEHGVVTYDKASNSLFSLRAAVMWTINDFPAYGSLSGWSTKGYLACPSCNEDVSSDWFSQKVCYMGARRWLPPDHHWRKNKESFNGEVELAAAPRDLSGDELLQQLNNINFGEMGKHESNPEKKRKRTSGEQNWTKKSIFFELGYWSKLKLRHNLDVMHIEKNVWDAVSGTILDIEGKTKDTLKARQDLENMGIRSQLWLQKEGNKLKKKHPFYQVDPKHRKDFFRFVKSAKFPDGYASNISSKVNVESCKFLGLKSHDCHVLLQRILPIGIRKYLPEDVSEPVVMLSSFFQQLCAKSLHLDDLDRLQDDIIYILCKFEQIFPPALFDIMIHLMVHLPYEAKLGGPVTFRWMYPVERMLGKYKGFVKNKALPEGSIAEADVAYDSLTFCSMYLHNVETSFNRPERNNDGDPANEKLSVFAQVARPFMGASKVCPSSIDLIQAQWFILNNCEEVSPFLLEHEDILRQESIENVEERLRELFPSWFDERMHSLGEAKSPLYNEELHSLARGAVRCETYQGCIVNGVKFIVEERDDRVTTQNSGVCVAAESSDDADFYGKLTSVVEVLYRNRYKVVLFQCHWFDTSSSVNGGIKRDYHLISVNTSTSWYENEPFILASMAKQVCYLNDPKAGDGWKVVQRIGTRNVWDDESKGSSDAYPRDDNVTYQENSSSDIPYMSQDHNDDLIQGPYSIEHVLPTMIDSITIDLGPLEEIETDFIDDRNHHYFEYSCSSEDDGTSDENSDDDSDYD